METNEVLMKLPQHLMSLVIDQPYNEYTAQDHAVWRFVMRQNVDYLSRVAHESYLGGLKKTGISINEIPHMYGMNRILKDIGWAAVAVDGFIPPAAFMEFQAYNVLVIAADIRPIDQIEYTPAPDIIHEAAGHAPIIADPYYAEYLKEFGRIGSKAFSSAKDYEQYEAIRYLSILKADPYTPKEQIEKALLDLEEIDRNMGEPSEMSLIRNLHWWTVEYGLIGSLKNPKIYGAGLLSSIGESYSALQDEVKKIPYDLNAVNYNFDITTQQPQLFVTPSFEYLTEVLEQFAQTMALVEGGKNAIVKAIDSENTATLELSSGIQISGTFTDTILLDEEPVFIKTSGPSALAFDNKQLDGHGKDFHRDGYSTPVGNLQAFDKPLEKMSPAELVEAGIEEGEDTMLEFRSGLRLEGRLKKVLRKNGCNLLFSFENCRVTFEDQVLFEPGWGIFDMAVGEKIRSGYTGPADADAWKLSYKPPKEKTHKILHSDEVRKLHELYADVRSLREYKLPKGDQELESRLKDIWNTVHNSYPADWLLSMEILELLTKSNTAQELRNEIRKSLLESKEKEPKLKNLIDNGLNLVGV